LRQRAAGVVEHFFQIAAQELPPAGVPSGPAHFPLKLQHRTRTAFRTSRDSENHRRIQHPDGGSAAGSLMRCSAGHHRQTDLPAKYGMFTKAGQIFFNIP